MDIKRKNKTRKFRKNTVLRTKYSISPGMSGSARTSEHICTTSEAVSEFDHPNDVENYFNHPTEGKNNLFKFIYGMGVILKYKETKMSEKIVAIEREIGKLNEEYVKNEENYTKLMEESQNSSASEMKEKLQETVREQLNKAYESKFSEILIKKQAYDVVVKGVINRRWWIVKELQEENQGRRIADNIIKSAKKIYSFYRGPKYKEIRSNLFNQIRTISDNPSLFRESFSLNASIVGPAGSGKTTMARLMAEWYAVLGIMTYDSFYEDKEYKLMLTEVSRANLIGEYTGQTAPKTLSVLAKTLEKTLFIDEAYSVTGCSFDSDGKVQADAYGEEFLATLLIFMNDHKGYNSVIVAGYENQMEKCFFARNEGLPRRFPNKIVLPFYATDELFGIFLKGTSQKLLTSIKSYTDSVMDNYSKILEPKQIVTDAKDTAEYNYEISSYYKFRYLTIMKPSFMMVHMDTTFDAIETLRKYLISIQLRILLTNHNNKAQTTLQYLKNGKGAPETNENQEFISLENIYSYTIIAHILMNLFEPDSKSARKQLFRRIFYRDVYKFVSQNLSYFPAQAGEMENIADKCIMTVGSKINDNVDEQVVMSFCDEASVMNAYLVNKKLQIELYQEGDFIGTAMVGGAQSSSVLNSAGTPTVPGSPRNAAVSDPRHAAASPATKKKYFLELNNYKSDLDDIQKRIHSFFNLSALFGHCIPTLKDLYAMLFDKGQMTRLTTHMVNLYLSKVSGEYLAGLLNMQDTEFPIHIVRKNLEAEIQDLQYINEYKPNQLMFDSEVKLRDLDDLKSVSQSLEDLSQDPEFKKLAELAQTQKAAVIEKAVVYNIDLVNSAKLNLRNPKIAKFQPDNKNSILKADVLYEDFGFYSNVYEDTSIPEASTDKDFKLNFLATFEPRLFALEQKQLINISKGEIAPKRADSFTKAEDKLKELVFVDEPATCTPNDAPESVAKTIENYKGAINTKLAAVRTKPVNEDELRIIEEKALAKARGKVKALAAK